MKAIGKFLRENGAVHDARQQLDPHQPAAVHHRGAAGRGLRDHRPRRSTSPTRRSPDRRVPMPVGDSDERGPRDAARRAAIGRWRRRLAAARSASCRSSSSCSSSGRSLKVLGGERWQIDSLLGTGHRASTGCRRSSSPFATDVKLPHTWVIALEFVDADANGLTTARSGWSARRSSRCGTRRSGSPSGSLLGLGLGDPARPRPAARALVRADHRGQPDHPDHRHRAAHRHRAQGRLVRRRDRRRPT